MEDIKVEFAAIESERALADFVSKFNLERTAESPSRAEYVGLVHGKTVELRERWWDSSSVYAVQPDKHEVIFLVNGVQLASIRFEGNS